MLSGTFICIVVSGIVNAVSGYMVTGTGATGAFLAQPDYQEFDGKRHGSEFA
jgi:hypothetical protein